MNAIPLINNAPRPNINVGSIGSPTFNPVAAGAKLGGSIGGNVMRQNPASMPVNNEAQLRQEVNTSIVALKREAFSLENLIAQAAQTLQDINKRLSELEGKQGDYVKKADATVESVGGDGKYISAISETDGKVNATATDLATSVASGNTNPVTSGAVASALSEIRFKLAANFVANSAVCSDSNLYNVVLDLGSTKMYFLTGWVLVKAGTYTSGTKILDLPVRALINQYVIGYNITSVTPTVYQFYMENGTKELVFNTNVTLPTMYIQFDQVIITYAS